MSNSIFKIVIIIFAIIIFNNCRQKDNMENVTSIIEKVKTKYAPDKRVAMFNVQGEMENNSIKIVGESNLEDGIEELMNELEKLNFNIKNEINMLPDKSLGEKIYGIVNLSVANIRSKPQHSAELATQSLLGTVVNVLKYEDGWYLVQTPDKYISWVDDDGIFLADENEMKNWKTSEKIIITKSYSVTYQDADKHSQKVSDLVIGDILKKIKVVGSYINVEFPDNRTGYIRKSHGEDYIKWLDDINADQQTVINTAAEYLGLPYLWGGTSSKGFDCSGFTKTVYYLNGIILPRDASQQVHVGELIDTEHDFSQLATGDLLFFGFKGSENKKERITHVGIYLGNNEYIHSAGRVRINSLDKNANNFNEFRLKTFIRAKRILGNYDNDENLIKNNSFYTIN